MPNKDPEALDDVKNLKITQTIKDFVTSLAQDVSEAKQERSWWDSNVDRYCDLRYGIRKEKTFPWPKCANYVLPLIDADIARIKPAYVNLINVSPIVIFEPYGGEDIEPAKKREQLFDWRLKTKVKFFESYVLGVDYMLEQGAVIFKVCWKFSTRTYTRYLELAELPQEVLNALYDPIVTDELLYHIIKENYLIDDSFEENVDEINKVVKMFREGKSEFELTLVEKKDDQPEFTPCSIREDIIFPVETTDINDALFIDYKFTRSLNALRIAMRDGKYEEFSDAEMHSWFDKGDDDEPTSSTQSDLAVLHETCVWYDVNKDGIDERCIVTWPHSNPAQVLRFIELPYDHGMWPYVLVKREINDTGVFASRGIAQMQEDFQNGVSTAFNQAVDNGTITNTPQVVTRQNSLVNIKNLRYVPGNVIETRGPTTDYEVRALGNVSQNFLFGQAQYLKSWADQRIGNVTSGITAPYNLPGNGQQGNKTKREIDLVSSLQTEVQSLELRVFQEQMADVYYQLDALYEQFGDDEETIITNEKPVKMSRQEIQGKFNIVPHGNLDNSNPALRVQKAWSLMQAFINDPDIRQRELKKLFLDYFDSRYTNLLFKTDEEKNQEQQQQLEQQQQVKQEAIQTQLGLKVAGDNLEVRKAAMMVPLEGAKYKQG